MAILLLSVYTLIDQCLLHLPPIQVTDLATYWSQAPVNEYSYQGGGEVCAPLLFSWQLMSQAYVNSPYNWHSPPSTQGAKPASMSCPSSWLIRISSLIHKPLISLLLTRDSLFNLKIGQLRAL